MSSPNLEQVVVAKAAEFFGDVAKRRAPNMPDAFGSELLAVGLARLVGETELNPLPELDPIAPVGGGAYRPGPARPRDLQKLIPQAQSLLLASGFKRRPLPQTCLVYAAMMTGSPKVEWTNVAISELTGIKDRIAISNVISRFIALGIARKIAHQKYGFVGVPSA